MAHWRTLGVLTVVVVLLGWVVGACGGSDEVPPLAEQPYRNLVGGYAIRYPEGWKYEDLDAEVWFSKGGKALFEGLPPSEPRVWVGALPLSEVTGVGNARVLLELLAQDASPGIEFGEVRDGIVGAEEGALVDFSGAGDGTPVLGRCAAVHRGPFAVMVVGSSTAETWRTFLPTFEAMLASMTFFEPPEVTPTPEPALLTPGVSRIDRRDDWPYLSGPAWSPDGSRLAVTTQIAGERIPLAKIYLLDVATGELTLLLEADNGFREVQGWSPQGDEIVFHAHNDITGIWVVKADGGAEPRFVSDGHAAAWSPSGKEVAVFTATGDSWADTSTTSLWVLDLDTGEKRLVFSKSADFRTGGDEPCWSPDGTRLAFALGQGEANEIYILDLATGDLHQLTQGGNNSYPTWSPDSSLIAYVSHGIRARKEFEDTIVIARADGSCSVPVLSLDSVFGLAWSPDGRRIAFDPLGSGIYLLDVATVLGEDFLRTGPVCP